MEDMYCDLWVDERDKDVSGSRSNGQSLVEVGQSPRVHHHPTFPGLRHTAVIADEPATTSL